MSHVSLPLVLVAAFVMAPTPVLAAGTLLHTVDFEAPGDFVGKDGVYSQVDSNVDTCEYDGTCATDSLAIIESPEPVRAGKRAVKVTYAKDDTSNGLRAEMKLANQFDHEYHVGFWYGFSVFIPDDWQFASSDHTVVLQIHAGAGPGSSPVVAIRVGDNGSWLVTTERNGTPNNQITDELGSTPIQKGVWADWVMHAIWSDASDEAPAVSDGMLEVWVNGKKVVDKQNWRTLYPTTETVTPTPTLYVKFGSYGAATDRVLYHDELRIAKGDGDLTALVSPPGSVTPDAGSPSGGSGGVDSGVPSGGGTSGNGASGGGAGTTGQGGAGASASGGGSTKAHPSEEDDSGCSCRIGGAEHNRSRDGLFLVALALGAAVRRTRARHD